MKSVIVKRIWTQRKANGWLFAELFIVFVILWYVIDFLLATFICSYEPKGFDTHHVYHVSIAGNPTLFDQYSEEEWADNYLQVFRLIKEYPGVESACYYAGTIPYENGTVVQNYSTDSLGCIKSFIRMVSKDFFDVFKVDMPDADLSAWEVKGYPRQAIVSKDLADSLFKDDRQIGRTFFDYYFPDKKYQLAGIASPTKLTEYDRYEPFIYIPAEDWMLKRGIPMLAIRVNPEMEYVFAERFAKDFRERLTIGPFYFSQIKAYDDVKKIYDTQTDNYIRSSVAILLFFIFNVFIGIMGTFWFRTRSRRGEVGLRMAIGASRHRIRLELMFEGVWILVISAVPASIACFNIWNTDLTVNTLIDATVPRFIIGITITFLLMLLMVITGIVYPAGRAMKVQPVVALHEE